MPSTAKWLALTCCLILAAPRTVEASRPSGRPAGEALRIDPLLLVEAASAWSLLAGDENPIWPGWDASSTPLLFYLPGIQDVLINHPAPPPGFVPYNGDLFAMGTEQQPSWRILVKNGPTIISVDGQNTSRTIGGVRTLVVADTLSNRKVNIQALIEAARRGDGGDAPLDYEALRGDPYDQIAMVTHEAFHVYQDRRAPTKGANEMLLVEYPVLSVDNNVKLALEGDALAEALRAADEDGCLEAAIRWLAIRESRRAGMDAGAIEYEDGTEFNEGLAKYVEYKLFEELEGRAIDPELAHDLALAQGFHGLGDLSAERERLIDQLRAQMRGEVNVNNDPYGTAPVRMRLYFSGMAIGAILDRLGADWKDAIMRPGTTLTELLAEDLMADDEELAAILEETLEDPAVEALVETKEKLARDGREDTMRLVEKILDGPNTRLVIDYAALAEARPQFAFSPFGLRGVDVDRMVYTQMPVGCRVSSSTGFQQRRTSPLLHETSRRRITFQLAEQVTRDQLAQALGRDDLPDGEIAGATFELPGVTLQIGRATVSWTEQEIVFSLR